MATTKSRVGLSAGVRRQAFALLGPPPKDGVPAQVACGDFHISQVTIYKLIAEGKVRAGWGESDAGKRALMVSAKDLGRYVATQDTKGNRIDESIVPDDGEPIADLARESGIAELTIRRWCGWETHPGLGRRMRSGKGPREITQSNGQVILVRAKLASRADVQWCVKLMKNPCHQKIPGNPGIWIADGIFKHSDGSFYLTDSYVAKHKEKFGYTDKGVSQLFAREMISRLEVVDPPRLFAKTAPDRRRKGRDAWCRFVYPEAELLSLADRQAGKAAGGDWLVDDEIWRDANGLWFSSVHIARRIGKDPNTMHWRLRASRKVKRFQKVPSKRKGRPVVVHHETEVRELLRIGPSASNGARRETVENHARPQREKHLKWKEWKLSGLSYNEVVQKEEDETGIRYSREAIIQGIKRLSD